MDELDFFPRSRPWNSREMLSGLTRSDIHLNDKELQPAIELFEFDMITEYDSHNLSQYFAKRRHQGMRFSSDFQTFERVWLIDERNHYEGYKLLLSMCTNRPEEELSKEAIQRQSDFTAIEHLLRDEFRICMVLAYDEIITANSCAMDFNLFSSFGHSAFRDWIKRVARDETFHFLNILDILKSHYSYRLKEAPRILGELVEYDCSEAKYGSTFVMDHDPKKFPRALLAHYCEKILQSLRDLSHCRSISFDPN